MNKNDQYLTGMPIEISNYGLSKVLLVRKEIIHIKHIMTEVFVHKSIKIEEQLSKINYSLYDYMEYLTNRIRRIHHISRNYVNNPNDIVKEDMNNFFPALEMIRGLRKVIVLDFDGVVTRSSFNQLYELCCEREQVQICSANPTITKGYFTKNNKSLPTVIHSMKGKIKKIKRLIDIQRKYDYVFYVDNEKEYLSIAWLFGLKTFQYKDNKIANFSLNMR